MKKLLFAAAAATALFAAAPANAQVYLGADPGGVGVQVGPLGVGVGDWRYRHGWRDAYVPRLPHGASADRDAVRQRGLSVAARLRLTPDHARKNGPERGHSFAGVAQIASPIRIERENEFARLLGGRIAECRVVVVARR